MKFYLVLAEGVENGRDTGGWDDTKYTAIEYEGVEVERVGSVVGQGVDSGADPKPLSEISKRESIVAKTVAPCRQKGGMG